jgi:tripartite-type tricarboxylate transporter receptor subunit TctC
MLRLGVALIALSAATAAGAADEPFYRGKRLTVLINFAAGGPTDIEGRLLAKHLTKHIEGQPGVIVQNMDGAGGMAGAGYLGEVAPKDGTVIGYFTGSAWRFANNPERFRIDFRSYEFVAYQPGTAVIYMRTDIPPGMKVARDIVKARGLVAGGLGAENSKDLLTAYRGSQAARLALQQNEINLYSESPPSYRAVVEPSLVRDGLVIPVWYEAVPSGDSFRPPKQVEGLPIGAFHEFYKEVMGALPSGQLWEAYRAVHTINGSMQRQVVLPPGVPQAAVGALRAAVERVNSDREHAEEALRTMGFVPEWVTGPEINKEVREALALSPDMRAFLADYVRRAAK